MPVKKTQRTNWWWLLILVLIITLGGGAYWGCQRANEASARNAVQTWCNLAEFPQGRANEKIVTRGGMFTREFEISFVANPSELGQWIQNSVGLQAAQIETSGNTTRYTIAPNRAIYCNAEINLQTGDVYIHTAWS